MRTDPVKFLTCAVAQGQPCRWLLLLTCPAPFGHQEAQARGRAVKEQSALPLVALPHLACLLMAFSRSLALPGRDAYTCGGKVPPPCPRARQGSLVTSRMLPSAIWSPWGASCEMHSRGAPRPHAKRRGSPSCFTHEGCVLRAGAITVCICP